MQHLKIGLFAIQRFRAKQFFQQLLAMPWILFWIFMIPRGSLIFLLAPSQVTISPGPALWISGSAYGVTRCFLPASKEIHKDAMHTVVHSIHLRFYQPSCRFSNPVAPNPVGLWPFKIKQCLLATPCNQLHISVCNDRFNQRVIFSPCFIWMKK